MRTLVTGGAGFIGSHVAEILLTGGHHVDIVDDLSTGHRRNLPTGAAFFQQDIREAELLPLFERLRPEVVFHLAAQMDVRHSVADPVFDGSVNVLGTVRVLEAARSSGCRLVVFASTGGAIYGEQEHFPAEEGHPCRPESPYGVSKFCAEQYLHYFARSGGPACICLRFANVYGPRQDPHGEAGVVAIFCRQMLRGEVPTINGDGLQTRDFVFVSDVARANLKALDFAKSGVFNIGTGQETDINTLAGELKRLCGFSGECIQGPPKAGEQRRSCLAVGLAAELLGWRPEVPLQEGLKSTVEFFRRAGEERGRAD